MKRMWLHSNHSCQVATVVYPDRSGSTTVDGGHANRYLSLAQWPAQIVAPLGDGAAGESGAFAGAEAGAPLGVTLR